MLSLFIFNFIIIAPPVSTPSVTQSPTAKRMLESKELPVDQELKLARGLLLKHRGGPGFGHGRLEGAELEALSSRLRSVVSKLSDEANQFVKQ